MKQVLKWKQYIMCVHIFCCSNELKMVAYHTSKLKAVTPAKEVATEAPERASSSSRWPMKMIDITWRRSCRPFATISGTTMSNCFFSSALANGSMSTFLLASPANEGRHAISLGAVAGVRFNITWKSYVPTCLKSSTMNCWNFWIKGLVKNQHKIIRVSAWT